MTTTTSLIEQRTWQVADAPFNPFKLAHLETIHTIGNGYMGLRGTLEEGYPGEMVSTLVHGIFDHAEGELVPDIVNLPNPLPVMIRVDGESFHMTAGTVLGYRQVLDLRTASLSREVLWRNRSGVIIKLHFERFASLAMQHVLVQRIRVYALNRPCTITVTASIDGTQTNEGVQHWASQDYGHRDGMCYVVGRTGQSGYRVAVASALDSDTPLPSQAVEAGRQPGLRMETALQVGQHATFYKYSAIHTSRDAEDPTAAALHTLAEARAQGWASLWVAHTAEWDACWHDSDVVIEGDEVAQRAIRFSIYHVLIAAPRQDERVSIGAKTLSGPGYSGHVFWDTELFMVPLLTVTQPHVARNLLMYRYHNLEGARRKARQAGYEGAMYPWESADTGDETTPQWTLPQPDGTRIRIWTGDTEQHISTDIAYAVMQYWRWTRDDAFFTRYGAEIVLDTAVFWGQRAEYNAERDRFEIRMQIGPDEYHENIDNSAFTNSMVRWHLYTAIGVAEWLRAYAPAEADALLTRLGITDARLDHWANVARKMFIPYDAERGILEQFEGFFALEPLDLTHWTPRVANMDWILGHATTQRTMVIKQADVVMLMALLGDSFGTRDAQRRNWDFYYPLVDHGSSLSPSIHAWVAARLGLTAEAYRLFMYAASIDLDDAKGNVRDGIHAAAAGGLWQAIVFGFTGLELVGDSYRLDPALPPHWQSVQFRIRVGGQQHTVIVPGAR